MKLVTEQRKVLKDFFLDLAKAGFAFGVAGLYFSQDIEFDQKVLSMIFGVTMALLFLRSSLYFSKEVAHE